MSSTQSNPLIIIGASARAAAQWAIRRGYAPFCIDLFCDRDLKEIAQAHRCPPNRYPDAIIELLTEAPPNAPVLLTGRMEHHLAVVEKIVELHRLLYSSVQAICKAKGLEVFAAAGCDGIRGLCLTAAASSDQRLVKSIDGKGRIRFDDGSPLTSNEYHQPFITGRPISAVYEGDTCWGASIQIIDDFRYIGSLGPIPIEPSMRELGKRLANHCGLTGLWGVDMVRDKTGTLWPLEINPRFCASMETIDTGRSKRYVFAPENVIVPDLYEIFNKDEVADVLEPDQPVAAGQPICTVLTDVSDISRADARLREMADRLYTRLQS